LVVASLSKSTFISHWSFILCYSHLPLSLNFFQIQHFSGSTLITLFYGSLGSALSSSQLQFWNCAWHTLFAACLTYSSTLIMEEVCWKFGKNMLSYLWKQCSFCLFLQDALLHKVNKDVYEPLIMNFSAHTSASQAQEIIINKLDRRRKGIFFLFFQDIDSLLCYLNT
jgi:hypothetical protein